MKKYEILVVDDDHNIVELIQLLLEGEGFTVHTCFTGEDAAAMLSNNNIREKISLIILDIMLPGKNGYKVCSEIRKNSNTPILFLSAMSGDSDKFTGFLSGGDDYLCKPFSTSELISRVKSLLRRCYVYQSGATSSAAGDSINPGTNPFVGSAVSSPFLKISNDNILEYNHERIELTYTEGEILRLLLKERGNIVSSEQIYEKVWGDPYKASSNNIIMVHILNLRRKIEKNGDKSRDRIIKTAWGKGYYIE